VALVLLAPPLIRGDEWNLATKFNVNHSFEVPGMVLQPNTHYVIRLFDSPSTRNVVQIYNEDQTQLLTMFMAISDERLEPTDKTLFTFIETQPGFPLPMKEWFYPGRLRGLEFVYPKEQALEIARHAREPILAADSSNLHDLSSIKVEAIGPLGTQAPVTETASITKSETTAVFEEKPSPEEPSAEPSVEENPPAQIYEDQELKAEQQNAEEFGQVAQNTEPPAVQEEQPAEPPAVTENRELPATAGELPLIALIGVLCLGAGFGLKVLSSKS
jgi:hypothetical protein